MVWFISRGSKMTENNPNWERGLITKLAADGLVGRRRRRRWGIFFKLLTFAYITFLLIVMVDWSSRTVLTGGKEHIPMVGLTALIASGPHSGAGKRTPALEAAVQDKNKQVGIVPFNPTIRN